MALEFNAEKHEYTYGGKRVPSVTGILPHDSRVRSFVGASRYEETRKEGVARHAKASDYLKGRITEDDPFVSVFAQFIRDQRLGELRLNEKMLYSKKHQFAGTPDMIFAGGIVDIKRSGGNPRHRALQLAGYSILSVENKVARKTKKWWVLVINSKGYSLTNVYNEHAEGMFLSLLQKRGIEESLKIYYNLV